VATNAHVIVGELCRKVEVAFPSARHPDKGPFPAHLAYEDTKRDLAFLIVETDLPPLELASSYQFQGGDDITIIGSPGTGGLITLQNAISRGVLSTQMTLGGLRYYQLGASVNPGNSGGPAFDSNGKVVGVVEARFTKAEALGLCIPVDDLLVALNHVSHLSDSGTCKNEEEHNLKTILRYLIGGGRFYAGTLTNYVEAMTVSMSRGGTAMDGLSVAARTVDSGAIDFIKTELNAEIRSELPRFLRDDKIAEDVRREIRELRSV
jgi:S1-C subfamily serine protease